MLTAVLPAATMSSFVTSLIEAPVEMFRHRVQVRVVSASPDSTACPMWHAVHAVLHAV